MASTAQSGGSPYRSPGHGSPLPHHHQAAAAAAAVSQVPAVYSASTGATISSMSSSSAASSNVFTAEMRDRQARGKDPNDGGSDSSGSGGMGGGRHHHHHHHQHQHHRSSRGGGGSEPFQVLEKRRKAAQILGTPELLMMDSLRHGESIPATRLRYTRMLCNVEAPMPLLEIQKPETQGQGGRKKSSSHGASSSATPSGRKESRGASR